MENNLHVFSLFVCFYVFSPLVGVFHLIMENTLHEPSMATGQKVESIASVCQRALISWQLVAHSPNEMGGIYHFVSITILRENTRHTNIFPGKDLDLTLWK